MYKYFETFIKSVIGALGVSAICGIGFTIHILITYTDKIDSIQKQMDELNMRTNNIYNYFIIEKHK